MSNIRFLLHRSNSLQYAQTHTQAPTLNVCVCVQRINSLWPTLLCSTCLSPTVHIPLRPYYSIRTQNCCLLKLHSLVVVGFFLPCRKCHQIVFCSFFVVVAALDKSFFVCLLLQCQSRKASSFVYMIILYGGTGGGGGSSERQYRLFVLFVSRLFTFTKIVDSIPFKILLS